MFDQSKFTPDLRTATKTRRCREMRICLVGGAAREVAVARSLLKSPKCSQLIVIAKHQNPALKEIAGAYQVSSLSDLEAIVNFCVSEKVRSLHI